MVAFASLDSAFNNSEMSDILSKQQRDLSKYDGNSNKQHDADASSSSLKRNHRNNRYLRSQQQNHKGRRDVAALSSSPTVAAASLSSSENNAMTPPSIAAAKPVASDCASFMRGCNLDDVENVMDMYTSDPQCRLEKETRRKNPEHRRRMARSEALQRQSLQRQSQLRQGLQGTPPVYDYMETVEPPFAPFEEDSALLHKSASLDDVRLETPSAENGYRIYGSDQYRRRRPRPEQDAEEEDAEEEEDASEEAAEATDGEASETLTGTCPRVREPTQTSTTTKGDSGGGSAPDPTSSHASKTANTTNNNAASVASSAYSQSTTYILEIALYIITGVLLIFVMDQFVHIGVQIGRASALSSL